MSIPVYTRLLTVSDYGVVNIFMATVQIATILLTLNTEVSISRFSYHTNDIEEFKKFIVTSIILSGSISLLMSGLTLFFLPQLAQVSELSEKLVIFILPVSLYYVINSIFTQIYNPMMESRRIAIVSSIQAYLAFGLSVVAILLLSKDKYYGQVYGTIMAMLILSVYLIKSIKSYVYFCFEWKYVKYILAYSLPNLPYALSGLIIAVFGRFVVGGNNGFAEAGIYSFASNIGALMGIVILVTHQAWNPYYFRYMNDKDTTSINKDYNLIWKLSLIAALCLSCFGSEIGVILGRPQYYSSLYLVPIFVLGYVLYQWAYVYMRNCGYAKKIIWNAVAVIISGISNVVLSVILNKKWGNVGVASAFVISYLVLLILSQMVNHYQLKLYVPKISVFLKPMIIFLFFWIGAFFINIYTEVTVPMFIGKIIFFILGSTVIAYSILQRVIRTRK